MSKPILPTLDTDGMPPLEPLGKSSWIVIIGPHAALRVNSEAEWSLEFNSMRFINEKPAATLEFWRPTRPRGSSELFRFPVKTHELPDDAMDILLGKDGVEVMRAGHGLIDLRPGCQRLLEKVATKD